MAEALNVPVSISIVITNYNKGDLLRRAWGSVMHQSDAPEEVILVDDCSDDEATLLALESLSPLRSRTVHIRNKNRLGASGAKNTGILAASSDVIMLLDADDELPKDAVAHTKTAFRLAPDADFVYGDVVRISNGGTKTVLMSGSAYTDSAGSIDLRRLAKSWELHGTSPITKKLFVDVGGLDNLHPRSDDSDFFRRALFAGKTGKYIPEIIYITHLDGSGNSRGIDPLVLSASWFRNIDFYLASLSRFEFLAMYLRKTALLILRLSKNTWKS